MIKIMTDKMLNEFASKERTKVENDMYILRRFEVIENNLYELSERVRAIECKVAEQTERSE